MRDEALSEGARKAGTGLGGPGHHDEVSVDFSCNPQELGGRVSRGKDDPEIQACRL
jgi:hypothetical protein